MEKIAIFTRCHGYAFPLAPKNCPSEYASQTFEARKKLAQWLEENKTHSQIRETENKKVHQYMRQDYFFTVEILEVDTTRPWMLHLSNGKERLWYLDNKDKNNMVKPEEIDVILL